MLDNVLSLISVYRLSLNAQEKQELCQRHLRKTKELEMFLLMLQSGMTLICIAQIHSFLTGNRFTRNLLQEANNS